MEEQLKIRLNAVKKRLFDIYYSNLNEMQRKAVYTVNGPLLVLAGAGSGKTTVLVRRISHIITFGNAYYGDTVHDATDNDVALLEGLASNAESLSKDALKAILTTFANEPCEPYRILSITFTNKAANEMKNRLASELGESAGEIWAGTFHSICVRLLRRYISLVGYDKDFTIYNQNDTKKVVSDIEKDFKINDKELPPKKVLNTISMQKNRLITPEMYEKEITLPIEKEYSRIYTEYQKRLKNSNAVDFDDIIMLTVKLLSDFEEVRLYTQNRFRYIFVDEYQDTNYAQFVLLDKIAAGCGNLMVVGDDDQSIYKFRGATIENILNFDNYYKNARVVLLEQNYRSTKTILGAANAVISHNADRKGKSLWCDGEKGDKITAKRLDSGEGEAVFVADEIETLVVNKKAHYRDIAILYRSNAQAQTFERVFAQSSLPHRILGGLRFFERKEVQDIISYLCVINNLTDSVRLSRIINQPRRGIGDTTMSKINELANLNDTDAFSIIKSHRDYPELSRAGEKLHAFASLIDELKRDSEVMPLDELFKTVIEKTGYIQMLEKDCDKIELRDRSENLSELISTAMAYEENHEEPSLAGYLEETALISDIDNYDESSDAVVLMTVHSAKGLEFKYVFIVGMEENIFPSLMSSASEEELSEERRLAYVAITRAKEKLYITNAKRRLLYGNTNYNPPSRFLKDIPEEYLDEPLNEDNNEFSRNSDFEMGYSDPSRYAARYQKPKSTVNRNSFNEAPAILKKPTQAAKTFVVGDKVSHMIFGDGVIKAAKPMAQDILYEIEFEGIGTKKIMGNYAKLSPAEE